MADIFREVDEDVRRDKAAEFWNKYQNWIIALALAIVLATGGYRYWDYQRRIAAEEAGAKFEAALQLSQQGKKDEAEAAFGALARGNASGYAVLARLRAAAAWAGGGASSSRSSRAARRIALRAAPS